MILNVLLFEALGDVASLNLCTVDEGLHSARLGRGLRPESNPIHDRVNHPQVQNSRAADRPWARPALMSAAPSR